MGILTDFVRDDDEVHSEGDMDDLNKDEDDEDTNALGSSVGSMQLNQEEPPPPDPAAVAAAAAYQEKMTEFYGMMDDHARAHAENFTNAEGKDGEKVAKQYAERQQKSINIGKQSAAMALPMMTDERDIETTRNLAYDGTTVLEDVKRLSWRLVAKRDSRPVRTEVKDEEDKKRIVEAFSQFCYERTIMAPMQALATLKKKKESVTDEKETEEGNENNQGQGYMSTKLGLFAGKKEIGEMFKMNERAKEKKALKESKKDESNDLQQIKVVQAQAYLVDFFHAHDSTSAGYKSISDEKLKTIATVYMHTRSADMKTKTALHGTFDAYLLVAGNEAILRSKLVAISK
jgi:hypothetical protein